MTVEDQDINDVVTGATDVPMHTPPEEHVPIDTGTQSPEQTETPSYEPNLNYQFKGEEFTFDERLHSIVKDKETEEFLRDTFTKSHGLDAVKTRLDDRDKEFTELQGQNNSTNEELGNFRTNFERLNKLKETDPHAFQRDWGLSDKWVLDRATRILELHENPGQAQLAEQNYQAGQQNWQNEQAMTRDSARAQGMERQLHDMKISDAMKGPEVGDFAKTYDERMGAGAFKAQVDDYGSLQYHQNQRYVDPQVAVAEVYGKLQKLFGTNPQAPTSLDPGGTATQPAGLPNLGQGRSGAPTTKRYNTIAELRAHAQEIAALN